MILIVGLGNPGKKYLKTRHNIGARVIDELGFLSDQNAILARPTTFMNESGKAVKKLCHKHKIEVNNLWVVHDDIDLPLGKIKISKNRGSAGHKGIESIIKSLSTKNFVRFRIGIKPKKHHKLSYGTEKLVLESFGKEEEKTVKEALGMTAEAIQLALREGLEKAMNKFNK